MIKIIVLLTAAATVYSRPTDHDSIHVVYPKMLSEIPVVPAEPRSGVAYVYSIPITEPPHHDSETVATAEETEGVGEASSVDDPEIIFKEVTVSKRVGFHKEGLELGAKHPSKDKPLQDIPVDPLDPKINES